MFEPPSAGQSSVLGFLEYNYFSDANKSLGMNRRRFLASLGAAGVGSTTGCVSPVLQLGGGPEDRTYEDNVADEVSADPVVRARRVVKGADGNWWVLEVAQDHEGVAAVYEYTREWAPAGTAAAFELPETDAGFSVVPVDIAPNPAGGWYVLGDNGALYEFDSQWTHTEATLTLPERDEWEVGSTHFGIERAQYGWWAFAYSRLIVYTTNFDKINASYYSYDDLDLGSEYVNDNYGNMTVGRIRAVHLSTTGNLILRANKGNKVYVFDEPNRNGLNSTAPAEVIVPDPNPDHSYGVTSDSDGHQYILRGRGILYKFTANWEFTDTSFEVGSGDAVDRWYAG